MGKIEAASNWEEMFSGLIGGQESVVYFELINNRITFMGNIFDYNPDLYEYKIVDTSIGNGQGFNIWYLNDDIGEDSPIVNSIEFGDGYSYFAGTHGYNFKVGPAFWANNFKVYRKLKTQSPTINLTSSPNPTL